jgi:AraC-like DNA-binding protein
MPSLAPANSTIRTDGVVLYRSPRVHIDQLPTLYATAALNNPPRIRATIIVLGNGRTLFYRGSLPRAEFANVPRQMERWPAAAVRHGGGTRVPCTVFQYAVSTDSVSSLQSELAQPAQRRLPLPERVHLTPLIQFAVYRRHRALSLGLDVPTAHTEQAALSLLAFVARGASQQHAWAAQRESGRLVEHAALARQVCAELEARPGDAHSLAGLAEKVGVSPFHLAHVFRSQMGVSLHQYLLQLRLLTALELLRDGARNLSSLALDLGFAHHSHFSSVFLRAIGYSPRVVRSMFRAQSVSDLYPTDLCDIPRLHDRVSLPPCDSLPQFASTGATPQPAPCPAPPSFVTSGGSR